MQANAHELVSAAQRGDEQAAVRLIEEFYRPVYHFLGRLAGSEADAADLTQKVFSRMWRMLPTVAKPASVTSWIHSIAYHTFVDWLRSRHAPEFRSEAWWLALPTTDERPDEKLIRADLASQVYAAVDQLELDLRHTVHLHYFQGLTLQETADALGVASSTVKYRLRQALAELQNQLGENQPLLKPSTSWRIA